MGSRFVALAAALAAWPLAAAAQEPAPAEEALSVFLDCQTRHCDFDHIRREVDFVNWVRDREDAGVHVLITAEATGGGGRAFSLAFLGRRGFAGRADTLAYTSRNTDTDAEVRDGLTRTIALGLVRYAAQTAVAPRLHVAYAPLTGAVVQAAPADDPWNFWTFRVGLNGSVEGEAQQDEWSVRGSVSASRTTEASKIQVGASGRYNREAFVLEDSSTFVNISERYSADVLAVWSMGPHWSVGVAADANRSTFSNQDLSVSGGPAIEYNIFPYAQSTRQQLSILYRVEGSAFDYQETTVAGRLSELRARHRLTVSAAVRQHWGQVHGSVQGTQYFHDLGVHRIDTFGGVELRLFRGFTFNAFVEFSRIKDQFSLPAAGLTEEEILVQRRERETDFRFDLNLGFSFRFGSKYANVVNPRMNSAGGVFF